MSWPPKSSGPRIKISGGNNLGDVKTATVVPSWISYSNLNWYRQTGTINGDGSITWGAETSTGGSGTTYTMQAADIPTDTSGPIRVYAYGDGPQVRSEYSVAYPPTTKTVTSFPYTMLTSDSGKTITLQPSAESVVNIIPNVSSNFVMSSAAGALWPVLFAESGGVQVTGAGVVQGASVSSGVRINDANNNSNNILVGAGTTATLASTSSTTATLTGGLGRYQSVVNRTGLCDATYAAAGIKQISGLSYHPVRAPAGAKIVGIKIGFERVYGATEIAPTVGTGFAAGFYATPASVGLTPQQLKFGGATLSSLATTSIIESDFLPLASPLVGQGLQNPFEIAIGCYQYMTDVGATTGCIAGKGKALREYFNYTTAQRATSSIDYTALAISSIPGYSTGGNVGDWPSNNLNGNGFGSPQGFRPAYIIGVTDTGALGLLQDSRGEPSNGDWPDVGGSPFAGDGESVWGNTGPTLNLGLAADSFTNWNTPASSSVRRSLLKYCQNIACHLGINDVAATNYAQYQSRVATFLASAEISIRKKWAGTLPPWQNTSTDGYTTVAGQSSSNPAQYETNRVSHNNSVRAVTAGFDGPGIEVADLMETSRDSGKIKVAPNGRTVSDLVVTSGSNLVSSATANFTTDDTGRYILAFLQSSTVRLPALMTYVSPTQVTLTFPMRPSVAINANASGTGGVSYVQACQYIGSDGLHGPQLWGKVVRAASFTLPAVR